MQSLTPRTEDALAAPAADAEGDELAKYLALAQEKLKKKATEEEDGPDPVLERGGEWRQKGSQKRRRHGSWHVNTSAARRLLLL